MTGCALRQAEQDREDTVRSSQAMQKVASSRAPSVAEPDVKCMESVSTG